MNTELFARLTKLCKFFAEAHQAKASHRINEGLRFFRAFRVRKKETPLRLSVLRNHEFETPWLDEFCLVKWKIGVEITLFIHYSDSA